MPRQERITLQGRVIITANIHAVAGLHIGGAAAEMAIGGVDNPVIRTPLNNQPYIPGSSLKGKMRSLSEKLQGKAQMQRIGQNVYIHTCMNETEYLTCAVCHVFGVPGERTFSTPTRLLVRDTFLTPESAADLGRAKTDLPYTEVKWEAAIDRVTSAATPRQMERVPAGAVFGPAELVYSVYEAGDIDRMRDLIAALQLLEDDYLGGQGSRGSGKVRFQDLVVTCKAKEGYALPSPPHHGPYADLAGLRQDEGLIEWIKQQIPIAE